MEVFTRAAGVPGFVEEFVEEFVEAFVEAFAPTSAGLLDGNGGVDCGALVLAVAAVALAAVALAVVALAAVELAATDGAGDPAAGAGDGADMAGFRTPGGAWGLGGDLPTAGSAAFTGLGAGAAWSGEGAGPLGCTTFHSNVLLLPTRFARSDRRCCARSKWPKPSP